MNSFYLFHLLALIVLSSSLPLPENDSSPVNSTLTSNSSQSSITSGLSSVVNFFTAPEGFSLNPDTNQAVTVNSQNDLLKMGQSMSVGITNQLVRPFVLFNNHVSSAAGSLPGIFAANGAVLGTAIATPIQLGTLAANGLISGITGSLVSIPVSLVTGGTAHAIGLMGSGQQLVQNTIGGPDQVQQAVIQGGQTILQPLAVFAGTNSILAGLGLNAIGSGFNRIGNHIEQIGVTMANAGQQTKNMAAGLIGWVNGRPVYFQTGDLDKSSLVESDTLAGEFITSTVSNQLETTTQTSLDEFSDISVSEEQGVELSSTDPDSSNLIEQSDFKESPISQLDKTSMEKTITNEDFTFQTSTLSTQNIEETLTNSSL